MPDLYIAEKNESGMRLDRFLVKTLDISRNSAQKMISRNLIEINGSIPKKTGILIKTGDKIKILPSIGHERSGARYVRKVNVKVIKDTDDYLIINKPAGLLVHSTEANEPNTLVDWILENYPDLDGVGENKNRPGVVHRLDKDASGIMVLAKNNEMFSFLKSQFKSRLVEKEYLVLVHGVIKSDYGRINFEIDRGKSGIMVSRPRVDLTKVKNVGKKQRGKAALTEFWVEDRFVNFTLLKINIHTGRTHQIRAHMMAYGYPVAGDKLYFNKKLNLKKDKELGRLFLHAAKLCFKDLAGDRICFRAELPGVLRGFIKKLK